MYPRYVPPPKVRDSPKPSVQVAEESSQARSARTGTSSAAPYARYIPPQKPTSETVPATGLSIGGRTSISKKIVFNDDDSPAPGPKKRKRGDEEQTGQKKKTKSRKKKRRTGPDSEDEDGPSTKPDTPLDKPAPGAVLPKEDVGHHGSDHGGERVDEPFSESHYQVEEEPANGPLSEADMDSPQVEPEEQPRSKREKKEKKEKRDKKARKERSQKMEGQVTEVAEDVNTVEAVPKHHQKVLQKRDRSLRLLQTARAEDDAVKDSTMADETEWECLDPIKAHGLEPIPQPETIAAEDIKIDYETLPTWLASPMRVAADARSSFASLGISADSAKILAEKGFPNAFAIQTAAIPLLMPSADRRGDVVISAATGSGKTLAYVLPMVSDITQDTVTRLRGIIVLPTRDLVHQVKSACDACVAAFSGSSRRRLKIETAMGNRQFKKEQSELMKEDFCFDPEGFQRLCRKREQLFGADESDEDEVRHELGVISTLRPDHVLRQSPKVDILVCTPGRLVEHITSTPGFTLDYVRWLVVDEADKLTGQDYQKWLNVVMDKLAVERPGARDFANCNQSGVRKVILSATMTRDLSMLNLLQLRRPTMVVLGEELRLPDGLKESAIKVRDSYFKTLYLVDLLFSEHLSPAGPKTEECSSSTSSDSDSSSDETPSPSGKKSKPASTLKTTVLIFTQSNESAMRLSRLLELLCPTLSGQMGVLTSSTPTARRARTLHAFGRGRVRVLVASDLVARGIDLVGLEHVVNYDVPISATAYIHRVGRTARAGRTGHAWTLIEYAHARRFWRDFAGVGTGAESTIVRTGKVERLELYGGRDGPKAGEGPEEFSAERREAYNSALEQLKSEATGQRERRGR